MVGILLTIILHEKISADADTKHKAKVEFSIQHIVFGEANWVISSFSKIYCTE